MVKTCPKCVTEKSVSEFYKNKGRKDGLQPYCKVCQLKTNNQWYANSESRRADIADRRKRHQQRLHEYLREHFLANPCVDCGEDDIVVLELDHRDSRTKVKAVANMISDQASMECFIAEVAKCDVRCANCHRRMTAKRHGAWWRTKDIAV